MAKYRCGLCRKVFDRPGVSLEWFRSRCRAKQDRLAIMRKVHERPQPDNTRRDAEK